MHSTPDQAFVEAADERLRREEPELGRLVAAIRFKRDMVDRFGAARALKIVRERLGLPQADLVERRPVRSLREAARCGSVYSELWSGGRPVRHDPPRVVGHGDQRGAICPDRAAYLGCLADAGVRGRSSVILTNGEALIDLEDHERGHFRVCPEVDPAVLYAEPGKYLTIVPRDWERIETAFMLGGYPSHDFGHWIVDFLPKLAVALMAGLPADTPLLADGRMPKTHYESLRLLAPEAPILKLPHLAPLRVARLWCAPSPGLRHFYPDWSEAWEWMVPAPSGFAAVVSFVKERLHGAISTPTGADRVYFARRPERKKRLTNSSEIEALCRDRGFTVVYPEDVSFVDQIRLAHHAHRIVAPDGSNALLSYFASSDARVCVLNNERTHPLLEMNGILKAVGAELTVFSGPTLGQSQPEMFWNDYEIATGPFARFLDDWLP